MSCCQEQQHQYTSPGGCVAVQPARYGRAWLFAMAMLTCSWLNVQFALQGINTIQAAEQLGSDDLVHSQKMWHTLRFIEACQDELQLMTSWQEACGSCRVVRPW